MTPITTNILRASYEKGLYSFGNPDAATRVCLIGSCRIVPILNNLRVYNEASGMPFELLCFDPVEMWGGPGSEVADGVNKVLGDYRIGAVDYLVCEHVQYCGALNTVRTSKQNIFDDLGCEPAVEIRLPNWNNVHIFDVETAIYDPQYAAMRHSDRVEALRERTEKHKAKFLSYCRESSFPILEQWVEDNWLTTRLGWSSSHPSLPLVWIIFNCIAGRMGISISPEVAKHPLCTTDVYKSTGMPLTQVDYDANHWKY